MNVNQVQSIKYLEEIYKEALESSFINSDFSHKKRVLVVSDYSGDRLEDNYNGYSFLFTDVEEGARHVMRMIEFRNSEPHLSVNSHFEYKKIWQDDLRRRLLPKNLDITDKLNGILVIFLIDKNFEWFTSGKSETISEFYKRMGFGEWKPHIAKKMLETFVLLAFLLSKIDTQKKEFTWLGDRDSRIGDNSIQQENSIKALINVFATFQIRFDDVHLHLQNKHTPDEDLNAIVDLAGGSILDVVDNQGHTRSISIEYLKWFSSQMGKLKKIAIQMENDDGKIKAYQVKYDASK